MKKFWNRSIFERAACFWKETVVLGTQCSTRLRRLPNELYSDSFHAVLVLICGLAKFQYCLTTVTVVVYMFIENKAKKGWNKYNIVLKSFISSNMKLILRNNSNVKLEPLDFSIKVKIHFLSKSITLTSVYNFLVKRS